MDPNLLIKSIRESFVGTIAVYRFGNCYQFYEILKTVFVDAEAYYDGNHVWTKINNKFYDILGEKDLHNVELKLIDDINLIQSLSKNKYLDINRKKLNVENFYK